MELLVNTKGLENIARQFPVVASRSLNRLRSAMKTYASEIIRKDFAIKKSRIDRHIRLSRSATPKNLAVGIRAKDSRIPLFQFANPRQTQTGVRTTVKLGNSKIIKHAFIATMMTGHKGIFIRKGKPRKMRSGRYKGKKRQPIVELVGPSVAELVGSEKMQQEIKNLARLRLERELASQLKHFLDTRS